MSIEADMPHNADSAADTGTDATHRLDRVIGYGAGVVFLAAGIGLWLTHGTAVFTAAISGLWALCF